MRIPKIHDYHLSKTETKEKIDYETISVELSPSEYIDDLGMFENEKELHKFVVRTKYYIRKSYEYESLIKFLKKYRGMYCCGVHNNITIYDNFPIEIHHTPLVMEDIIYIIINKRLKLGESMKQSKIAKEVMKLHYLGLVGLYPLCSTCHEYVHSETNDLFIPLTDVFGDPEEFFRIYQDFISSAMKEKFKNIQQLNQGYGFIQENIPEGLIRKYIIVEQKGSEMVSTKRLYSMIHDLANGDLDQYFL